MSRLSQWRKTQECWDDREFLAFKANAFMKLRWRRLNRRAAQELAALFARLGRGVDLVDLGCGHADFCISALPWLRSYTGIEPSKALLPKSRRQGTAFRCLRAKAERLPLPAQSADFVLIKEVLDHCYDPPRVLREAWRILRPGGELLVTLTNDAAWYKRLFPTRAARVKAGQQDHLFFFKPYQVLHLASQAGFQYLQEQDSHYLRLPAVLEELLGRLPEAFGSALIAATDAVGALVAPSAGGSFWVRAFK